MKTTNILVNCVKDWGNHLLGAIRIVSGTTFGRNVDGKGKIDMYALILRFD